MNHHVCQGAMPLPDTPAPPRFLLTNSTRAIFIDTEGGLCLLHPQRFNALDPIRFPFPGTITNAVLLGDNLLVSTWVEREISLARLAVLDLREAIQNGVELPDLRMAMDGGEIDHFHVAGATWSHVLDAEPLALCVYENDIIFCTHHRGLYRVSFNSDEIWRRKPITWNSLEGLPDGDVIVSMLSLNDEIWVFSLGGGWAEISASDGSVLRRGTLKFKSSVNQVWSGAEGEWLFGLSHNRIAWWNSFDNNTQIENVHGPIQDAIWSGERWMITGWREDIIWNPGNTSIEYPQLRCSPRAEIGHRILERNEEGYWVLDNRGQWSPFAVKLD
jgi:hypothetical protein